MSENKIISLPERDYYPLNKASEILKCDIQDIYHFAARGHLTISLMMPFYVCARVSVHGDMKLNVLSDIDLERIDKEQIIDEVKLTNLATIYDVSISSEYDGCLAATIGGVWDLNMGAAEMLECFGYATTKTIGAVYPTGLTNSIDFYAHFESETVKIKDEYLCITKENISYVLGGEESAFVKREVQRPHLTEYHAKKRESVLKAALYMKVHHPDLCINNTKWAESINEHAHKFWENGEPPLAVDTICDLLGKSLSVSK